MKREEKNKIVIRKILDSALQEFGSNGYGLSSINNICTNGGISKGVLYHHFQDKDELYIACVKECFDHLTTYLREHISETGKSPEEKLGIYFDARLVFFEQNPLHQKLFCSAVILPPPQLAAAIKSAKADFDSFNIAFLTQILEQFQLRPDVNINEAVELFRSYQDFVNAQVQMEPINETTIKKQEQMRRRAVQTLLYGVVERKGE